MRKMRKVPGAAAREIARDELVLQEFEPSLNPREKLGLGREPCAYGKPDPDSHVYETRDFETGALIDQNVDPPQTIVDTRSAFTVERWNAQIGYGYRQRFDRV